MAILVSSNRLHAHSYLLLLPGFLHDQYLLPPDNVCLFRELTRDASGNARKALEMMLVGLS